MVSKTIMNELKKFVNRLNEDFEILDIILFGSRVNGKEGKEVDFDLIIVSSDFDKMGFFERGAKMYDYWELDYPVDFLCYTPKEFNKLKNKVSIVKEAIETGINI